MKRNKFIKYLSKYNCILLREGAKHSIYKNLSNEYKTAVPRHNELKNNTCKEICKQLEIPSPF